MQNYQFDENGQFIIKDFQRTRPFASFLPGIAGPMGIPLWVFYVNRGQAIASFGVENKDKPIMEYQPANRAYQLTPYLGFRTFIRQRSGNKWIQKEPFSRNTSSQKMFTRANELYLMEDDTRNGLKMEVVYFLLPVEEIAALVRQVVITNESDQLTKLEILDGLPAVIPYGLNNQFLKEIGRTVEAWMMVDNLAQNIPFYHLRASVADTTEVRSIDSGHFMFAWQEGAKEPELLSVIVDPALVFGQNTSLSTPEAFYKNGLTKLLTQKQIVSGRTPSGFAALQVELLPGEAVRINGLFGHASSLENLQPQIKHITSPRFLDEKRLVANTLVRDLTDGISCRTSSRIFDEYCRQTFLDNTLRGGWPITFGSGKTKHVYHIYSRKHGDLERDYNAFSIAPEHYSQGNGSYRDINQNRRDEVWFNPGIGDSNIRVFMSFIQADGYNPLVVLGDRFILTPGKMENILTLTNDPEGIRKLLSQPFSPGSLIQGIMSGCIPLTINIELFIGRVIEESEQLINAIPGEGYWVDHWTYNLDMIDSYLEVFPDRLQDVLFSNKDLPFYDSPMVVKPRSEKYVLVDGQPRQRNSLFEDHQKTDMIARRGENSIWLRAEHGKGKIYRTNLFGKLFILALIKFASLDPYGMGIEMEAGRPGWDDAMNGLPGLFGSSMPETYALKRLLSFLRKVLPHEGMENIRLPVEIARFYRKVIKELKAYHSNEEKDRDHEYWDHISSAREAYRAHIRLGLDGDEEDLSFSELDKALDLFSTKMDSGIARALELNGELPPTYFIFRVEEYELLVDKQNHPLYDSQGHSYIIAKRFSPTPLPLFLEGMVRAMRCMDSVSAEKLYEQVKASPLYDRKLKMYKLNETLVEMPLDIGRIRAFPPGWLENESIWLHMEYKYLLEVLQAGLFVQFIEDFNNTLIPFLDPQKYGRSTLENSSFLVSSAHPDESLHGTGFIARLSGASAEFISIWRRMMAGGNPFFMKGGKLCLTFQPILPGWLFDENNQVSFSFLGKTKIVYNNPHRCDTFDSQTHIQKMVLQYRDGESIILSGEVIPSHHAIEIREGQITQVEVYFDMNYPPKSMEIA